MARLSRGQFIRSLERFAAESSAREPNPELPTEVGVKPVQTVVTESFLLTAGRAEKSLTFIGTGIKDHTPEDKDLLVTSVVFDVLADTVDNPADAKIELAYDKTTQEGFGGGSGVGMIFEDSVSRTNNEQFRTRVVGRIPVPEGTTLSAFISGTDTNGTGTTFNVFGFEIPVLPSLGVDIESKTFFP